MTASDEPMLAAGPAAREEVPAWEAEEIRRRFGREGKLAGEAWSAFRAEFGKVRQSDIHYSAAMRAFAASWTELLREIHTEESR